jgi:hypothetical protein
LYDFSDEIYEYFFDKISIDFMRNGYRCLYDE